MASILVIDDETNIRTMIRLTLEHSGYTVATASDGKEGLDKYGEGADWDLVLLDQRMPGLEGITVLKQIRYHNPNSRVIMITAFGTVDLAVEAMKAGATDFLRKPFTAETLRRAVEAALQSEATPYKPMPVTSSPDSSTPTFTFGMSTINGFRIESRPDAPLNISGDLGFYFNVRNPARETRQVTVVLPLYVVELVKAHTDREQLPGGNRFWQALSEEALANYLYQQADFPQESMLRVEEFTTGMRRWVDSVLSGG